MKKFFIIIFLISNISFINSWREIAKFSDKSICEGNCQYRCSQQNLSEARCSGKCCTQQICRNGYGCWVCECQQKEKK